VEFKVKASAMPAAQDLATALQRAEAVLQRRPEMGLHDDAPALARWEGGTRVTANHSNGTQLSTDMPCELGGTGDRITPGWIFRAGLANCTATAIAMAAAARGIDLEALEVQVCSRTDTRGLLAMADGDGRAVGSTPRDYQLNVRVSAPGTSRDQLSALVDDGLRRSPMQNAIQNALPLTVHLEIDTH
jgi:uncharacterized OsmC-like protein